MATTVQVELIVDEKGAVQGVRAFNAAIQGTQVDVNKLDATLDRLNQHLDQLGRKVNVPRQLGDGAREMGGHFATSLDKVRLLRQEFGLFMPRAMESMIARSQALMGIINGLQGAIVGVGAALVAWSAVKEVVSGVEYLRDNFFSLTKAAQDYNAEVQKAKQEDFGNPHSVETLTLRLKDAVRAAESLHDLAQSTANISWVQVAMDAGTGNMTSLILKAQTAGLEKQATDQDRLADKLKKLRDLQNAHEDNLKLIDLRHAGDAALPEAGRIREQKFEKRERAAEDRRYGIAVDKYLGNPVDQNSGKQEMDRQDAIAEREANAQTFNLSREQSTQLRHLKEQANQAELRGVALYQAKETAAIAEITEELQKMGASQQLVEAATNEVRRRFHAEQMQRIQEEREAVAKRSREASTAGLTGIAKIQAQGANRDLDILADVQAGKYIHKSDAIEDHKTNVQRTNAEILASEQEFDDKFTALQLSTTERQVQGFARIRAEGDRQIAEWRRQFEAEYGTDTANPIYKAHAGQLSGGIAIIQRSTQDQQAELARRNASETEQIEDAARAKFFSAEKDKTAAIQAEYQERLAKLDEQLHAKEILEGDYDRRRAAAHLEMEAQLQEAAEQTRQKIASELSGIIGAHPLEGLQRAGERLSAQAGAAILQRISGRYGVQGRGSVFDRIAGVQHSTIDQHAELPGMRGATAGAGIFSVGSATIHVGSANIVGGGTGAAAGSGGGFGYMPPGIGGGLVSSSFSGAGAGGGVSWSGGTSPAPGAGFAGIASPSITPSSGGGFSGVANTVVSGASTANSLISMMKKPAAGLETQTADRFGHFDKNGDYVSGGPSAWDQSMLGGGMNMSNTLGAAGAGLGLFSAFKTGGVGGMMGGAMSGAQLGMEVGGPIGAAIGAIGGLALGFFGGVGQARLYNERQVLPRIGNDTKGFESGSMGYSSAYSDLQSLEMEARSATNKMGFAGERYYQSTIKGELSRAMANLTREERAGRSQFGFSAAQFDIGADSVPRDGWAVIHRKERIIPGDQNERITRSLEGAHALYRMAMQPSARMAAQGGDRTLNMNISALDAKSVAQLFHQHKHAMRAALNDSYAENSGGADASY